MTVPLVTESPFFKDFCNEYQQLTPYGVFFHGQILLTKGLVLNWTQAESDMLSACHVAVTKYSVVCGWAKFERLLFLTCHYFCSLLFEGRHTSGLQKFITVCLSTADEVRAVYFLWKVNFTRMATL